MNAASSTRCRPLLHLLASPPTPAPTHSPPYCLARGRKIGFAPSPPSCHRQNVQGAPFAQPPMLHEAFTSACLCAYQRTHMRMYRCESAHVPSSPHVCVGACVSADPGNT
eukprot:2081645-Pleurochrysis_carterae.AAC.1